ncbi:hypothetical protein OE699_12835 [Sedimentimonas flavescens]|uniref:Uncharacterized protein n=1 Tax=Sedimentimonas flavescens TaxID=2851012 RepID=A0ABT3A1B0_9RHOB|nr:hypothetical protein [Sedimentimonas flavescens]MCV2879733.1 hypothetical protein [Sedimentimonas flavescens]
MNFELTPQEQARLDSAGRVLTAAATEAGLTAPAEIFRELPSVKLAVLTDDGLDVESALRELRQRPEMAEQLRAQELKEALSNAGSDLHADLARMNPHQRMTYGRQLGAAKPAPEKAKLTADEEAIITLTLRNLPPAERISAARKAGLV